MANTTAAAVIENKKKFPGVPAPLAHIGRGPDIRPAPDTNDASDDEHAPPATKRKIKEEEEVTYEEFSWTEFSADRLLITNSASDSELINKYTRQNIQHAESVKEEESIPNLNVPQNKLLKIGPQFLTTSIANEISTTLPDALTSTQNIVKNEIGDSLMVSVQSSADMHHSYLPVPSSSQYCLAQSQHAQVDKNADVMEPRPSVPAEEFVSTSTNKYAEQIATNSNDDDSVRNILKILMKKVTNIENGMQLLLQGNSLKPGKCEHCFHCNPLLIEESEIDFKQIKSKEDLVCLETKLKGNPEFKRDFVKFCFNIIGIERKAEEIGSCCLELSRAIFDKTFWAKTSWLGTIQSGGNKFALSEHSIFFGILSLHHNKNN